MTEFNLSDKIGFVHDYGIREEKDIHSAVVQGVIELEDVKEFIRLLKKGAEDMTGMSGDTHLPDLLELIDKLAGDKLI